MDHLKPVVGEHQLSCPGCSTTLFLLGPCTTDVPGRDVWLTDGDAVPDVRAHLRPDQVAPEAFECFLSIGTCSGCRQGYYVVEATFIEGPMDLLYDWMDGSMEEVSLTNFLCTSDPSTPTWVLLHGQTKHGPVNQHMFGPFPADVTKLQGTHGVAACGGLLQASAAWEHARSLLLDRWDQMRAINSQASSQSA